MYNALGFYFPKTGSLVLAHSEPTHIYTNSSLVWPIGCKLDNVLARRKKMYKKKSAKQKEILFLDCCAVVNVYPFFYYITEKQRKLQAFPLKKALSTNRYNMDRRQRGGKHRNERWIKCYYSRRGNILANSIYACHKLNYVGIFSTEKFFSGFFCKLGACLHIIFTKNCKCVGGGHWLIQQGDLITLREKNSVTTGLLN